MKTSPADKHVKAAAIVAEFGFTARHWIRLAAKGKIPGARQPSGPNGCWTFDLTAFRRWHNSTARRVTTWPGYTGAEKRGGGAFNVPAVNTGDPSRRDLKASLASVLRNGSTG